MQVRKAFRANVLIYGRLWLQRPLLWAIGAPSSIWAFVAPSSTSMCVASPSPLFGVLGQRSHLWTSMAPSSSFMGVFCFRSPVAEKLRMTPIARGNTAALPIPRQRYRFRTNSSLEGVSRQCSHIWAVAASSFSFVRVCASAHCDCGRLCLLFFAVAGLYVFGFGEKSPRCAHFFE